MQVDQSNQVDRSKLCVNTKCSAMMNIQNLKWSEVSHTFWQASQSFKATVPKFTLEKTKLIAVKDSQMLQSSGEGFIL
jgi:hypothetical protein